jgi:hypothetical protein
MKKMVCCEKHLGLGSFNSVIMELEAAVGLHLVLVVQHCELNLEELLMALGAPWPKARPRGLALEKHIPSDCNFRNLSNVAEGAGTRMFDRIVD